MILDEKAEIWIYGYGGRGRTIATRLGHENIEICGFMDRNPEQYKNANQCVRILKPENLLPSPNIIVICSITNVFTHKAIAKQLADFGFSYIISKNFQNNQAGKRISRLYDTLTSAVDTSSVKGQEIPPYVDTIKETKVEMANKDISYANIPVELLFGVTRECLENSLLVKDKHILDVIPEQSLLYYTSPKKMLQFFMGETDENIWNRCKDLWFTCRNAQSFTSLIDEGYSEADQNRNLDDRYEIFQQMDQIFCENPTFFVENPISVVWNKKGWFNIQDGNNRAAFLLAKKVYSIPAQMKKDDYNLWTQQEKAVEQTKNIINDMALKLRSPILHPFFKDFPVDLTYYSHRKVAVICDWLWKQQMVPGNLSICEYYCSNDLCGSHLARMGCNLTVFDNEKQVLLHKALDTLYLLHGVSYNTQQKSFYHIILSNQPSAIKELSERGLRTEWYILEFINKTDSEIETMIAHISNEKPQYLMRQLVGSKIYKVIIVKGVKQ